MTTGRKPVETHTGTKKSAFLTFRGGLQSLVQTMIRELHDVEQRTGAAAAAISKSGLQGAPRYMVHLKAAKFCRRMTSTLPCRILPLQAYSGRMWMYHRWRT